MVKRFLLVTISLAFSLMLSAHSASLKSTLTSSVHNPFVMDSLSLNELIELAVSFRNNKPDSAIIISKYVLDKADSTDYQTRFKAYKAITSAYYMTSDAQLCYDYSQKLIQTAEKIGDKSFMLDGKLYLGLAFLLQDKFQEGADVFDDYLSLAIEMQDSVAMARAYLNRSINYQYLKNYDQALYDVNQCIDLAINMGNDYFEAMGRNRSGYILSDLGRFDEAVANHKASLKLITEDNEWERSFAYAGLAHSYLGLKQYDESIKYGLSAIELAEKMATKWDIQNAAEILYQAYEAQGDYENAFKYHKKYKIYFDSIHSETNEKKIHELQLHHAEMQRVALVKENNLQQEILNQRNTQIILVLSLAIILLLVIGVLYYVYITKRRFASELAKQHQKLDQLNNTKNKIFSIVAHDMRSPMQTVMALLYLIKNDRESVDIEEIVDSVHEKVSVVSDSLNSILEWSLTQFQDEQNHPISINVSSVINEQINLCNYEAGQKGVKIVRSETGGGKVYVVGEHLRIIVRNILSNAIKFTNEGGKISIDYKDIDSQIAIDISDTGVGMSEDQLANLFVSRGITKVGTKREVGTGIGLFLCREYAELNGGTIEVNSIYGEGTTFSVILPKA